MTPLLRQAPFAQELSCASQKHGHRQGPREAARSALRGGPPHPTWLPVASHPLVCRICSWGWFCVCFFVTRGVFGKSLELIFTAFLLLRIVPHA